MCLTVLCVDASEAEEPVNENDADCIFAIYSQILDK